VVPGANAELVFAADRLPSIIDHDEWPVVSRRRELDDVMGVREHRVGAVLSVGPIPIVASIYGLARKPRVGAHLAAKRVNGGERRLTLVARATDDVAHVEDALSELDADATAPHVGPEADALRIDLPEAERSCPGADAVRMSDRAVVRGEIPRHDAVGRPAAPLEISVRAFPRVAENEACVGHAATPA
jgi:hypothetical protein